MSGHELELRPTPRELSEGEDQNQSQKGRWVNSHELLAGDVIIGKNGELLRIESVSQRFEPEFPVSNLTIGEYHNYAVGTDSILVHNSTICQAGEDALRGMYNSGEASYDEIVYLTRGKLNQDEVLKRILSSGLPPGFDPSKGFSTFEGFKAAFGAAGTNQAWHHVVEQTINSGEFAPELLINPANLFKLPHGVGTIHNKIPGYYSSKIPGLTGDKTVRDWVSTKTLREQYDFGIDIIKQF